MAPRPLAPGARPGVGRAPRWSEGIVGSMTHCAGYHAAAVARGTSVAALGVDGEPHGPVAEGVRELITLPEERSGLERLDFGRCAVTPDPEHGTFTAVLKVPGPVVGGVRLDGFDGRWRVRHGLVVTAVVIPAPTSERVG
ncbi:hypothetical protein AB0478_22975 [Streptomyces sp. NPDC051917]|uniref:hypothetical protein n=2 Tax=unclassified Streptomyces TaxID=2593676 RepID=UPI00344C1728